MEDLDVLSDHELLLGGVRASIAENRAGGEKWARMVTYFHRRVADQKVRDVVDDHFSLTAREATSVEVGELWGMPDGWVRRQLNIALCLHEHFRFVWELCLSGQLDCYRATIIADAVRTELSSPEEFAVVAEAVETFLTRHLKEIPGIEVPVVSCTPKQLRNRLSYVLRRLRSRDAAERFSRAHENREIRVSWGEDGVSWLTLAGTTDARWRSCGPILRWTWSSRGRVPRSRCRSTHGRW